jgi:hypothetical protein
VQLVPQLCLDGARILTPVSPGNLLLPSTSSSSSVVSSLCSHRPFLTAAAPRGYVQVGQVVELSLNMILWLCVTELAGHQRA